MKTSELNFEFPTDLIATEPLHPSRVLLNQNGQTSEVSWAGFLELFQSGDILVLNDTKVLKRRIFSEDGHEILFLERLESENQWSVLFPAKKLNIGDQIKLPLGVAAELVQKGIPQVLRLNENILESYFDKVGELPLPPYVQKARNERHNREHENEAYQTLWAEKPGSLAAPTASLHFNQNDLDVLKSKGVVVLYITLHVGLGTFLPVTAETLEEHRMHSEWVEIPASVWQKIQAAKARNTPIWALGTTVVRCLESQALGRFALRGSSYSGTTDLMIRPGFSFQVVSRLLTNFHQPQSTLLALVMAFAGKDNVLKTYRWAIEKKYRLFSYGDLSVWTK